jgi:hypothetical protein
MVATMKMSYSPEQYEPQGAERRIFPRKEVHDNIQGKRLDHTLSARREPVLALALRDISMGGLSAVSETAVEQGERVTVYFPPKGVSRGWDAIGRVIRCQPSTFGYRVAVEFDPIPMAA